VKLLPRPTDESLVSWYTAGLVILWPPFTALTRRDWRGAVQLRTPGEGLVVAVNHISWIDPFVVAHFVNDNGRSVRFLAKSEVFEVPLGGRILKGTNQIPVYREVAGGGGAVDAAVVAVRSGECVIVYPEGTITRDPDIWPMTGKTGAARIALESRRPVVPVAQWGAQEIMPPYEMRVSLFPPRTVRVRAGDPVDLSDLYDLPITDEVLEVATNRIMDAITAQLALIRGIPAPEGRWSRKADARVARGPTHPQSPAETAPARKKARPASRPPAARKTSTVPRKPVPARASAAASTESAPARRPTAARKAARAARRPTATKAGARTSTPDSTTPPIEE